MNTTPINGDINACKKACGDNVDCEAYTLDGTVCNIKGFDPAPNMIHSWKTVKKTSLVSDVNDQNLLNCCANSPDAKDCNGSLPYSKQCDATMVQLCQKYPYLDACACVVRANNYQYQKVKADIKTRTGVDLKDECWYPYCRTASGSYIPTTMTPMTLTYQDDDHLNRLDNLRCSGAKSCNITDIYNPNLTSNCVGITVTDVPVPPIVESFDDLTGIDDKHSANRWDESADPTEKFGNVYGYDCSDQSDKYSLISKPDQLMLLNAKFTRPTMYTSSYEPSKPESTNNSFNHPLINTPIRNVRQTKSRLSFDPNTVFFIIALILIFIFWRVAKY